MNEFPMAPVTTSLYYLIAAGTSVLLGALIAFFIYTGYGVRNASVALTGQALEVSAGMYSKSIDRSALKVSEARIVDLEADKKLEPVKRQNGVGLPSVKSGWFELRDGEKAFLFVSDPKRVVYIPTTEGYALLLSPNDPDAFIAALRK